jgi:hypothetical protein
VTATTRATAAFYDELGPVARWLGTLAGQVDPASILAVPPGRLVLRAADPMSFADAVADLFDVWADEGLGDTDHPGHGGTAPEQRHAEWIYRFHRGRVWITTGETTPRATPGVAATTTTDTIVTADTDPPATTSPASARQPRTHLDRGSPRRRHHDERTER